MIFPRHLLSLCALFFLVAVVSANFEVQTPGNIYDEEVSQVKVRQARNPVHFREAVAVIRQAVKWATKHCLEEAALHCKHHWKNPKALGHCGKAFIARDRCASG